MVLLTETHKKNPLSDVAMDLRIDIISRLQELTHHDSVEIVLRGNSAIQSALCLVPKSKKVLIPQEGGWLSYKTLPSKLGLVVEEVRCVDAVIDLQDLAQKLSTRAFGALLYQNPGGYFAEQPMREIYDVCTAHGCLVILDFSGSLGTKLCDGRYANVLVGSFGEWKLVEAKTGGFISCRDQTLFQKLPLAILDDEQKLQVIARELAKLPERIAFLTHRRERIIRDLHGFDIVHPRDIGFVVVVRVSDDEEKQKIIAYCQQQNLAWTECPRYIRLNRPAISIEVKRLPG